MGMMNERMKFLTITDSLDGDFDDENFLTMEELQAVFERQRPRLEEFCRLEQIKLDRAKGKAALHGIDS